MKTNQTNGVFFSALWVVESKETFDFNGFRKIIQERV